MLQPLEPNSKIANIWLIKSHTSNYCDTHNIVSSPQPPTPTTNHLLMDTWQHLVAVCHCVVVRRKEPCSSLNCFDIFSRQETRLLSTLKPRLLCNFICTTTHIEFIYVKGSRLLSPYVSVMFWFPRIMIDLLLIFRYVTEISTYTVWFSNSAVKTVLLFK